MRVHTLRVTAFGPFAETVEVDLDALSQDGLFLLCGPTGAGKTSLLDAIAFALYGRVPGARGQEKRLRSDHSPATVRTEVVCEMTLRGERVRITRRPEQVRPKARGGGTTKDHALLHVQRQVSGAWEPVSIRLDEGGEYLRNQVGLSPEQFWQVVLLPQGEFAEFLRAEPDQRAKLLETLFDARRFADVEEWLAEHARSARDALSRAQETVDRLLHRVEQAARGLSAARSDGQTIAMPLTEDPEQVRTYLSHQLTLADTHLVAAEIEDEESRARLAATETGRDRGRRALRAAEQLVSVCRQRDFLNARSGQLAQARTRLADAMAAEPLRSFLDADLAAATQVRELSADLEAAYAALSALDLGNECPVGLHASTGAEEQRLELVARRNATTGRSSGATPESALRLWSRSLLDDVARLTDLESEVVQVEAGEESLQELVEEQAKRQACLENLRSVYSQVPAALATLELRRDAARLAAAGQQHTANALTQARARVTAATRAAELTDVLTEAQAEFLIAQGAALQSKAEWLALREARLAGIAAELAAALVHGQACPVCGSDEHPAPAVQASSAVSAADEKVSADRCEVLDRASQRAGAFIAEVRAELDACISAAAGVTVSAARKQVAIAASADTAAREAAEQLPGLLLEYGQLVAGRDDVVSQIAQLTEQQAGDRATAKALAASVRAGRRRLDKATGQDRSLAARQARLGALAEAAEGVVLADSAHTSAVAAATICRQKLRTRLQRGKFPSAQAAQRALLDEASRLRLVATIREQEDSQTGTAAELIAAADELRSALTALEESGERTDANLPSSPGPGQPSDGDWCPTPLVTDLAVLVGAARARLDSEHGAAEEARNRAIALISRARPIRGQLGELQVLLDQALAECDPVRETSGQAGALAALVAGGGANVKKMRLRSYVLAARLEQVATAATARLGQMSGGRYGFVHSDDLRGGNRRSGLSVDILDSHTGTQRPTKTLSGGESFMASLALALGLADVVTAESGGIELDTLFVDEGFGSLDPNSLDAVMTVLDELRQGGRVVGIVSHVEELRTRIPMQLQIRTSSHGSTLDRVADRDEARSGLLAG